jgi:diamine N-acetyltransferase
MNPIPDPKRLLIRRAAVEDSARLASLAVTTFTETFGHLYDREDLLSFLSATRSPIAYSALLEDPDIGVWLATLEPEAAPVGYAVAGPCKLPVPDLQAPAGEIRELYVLAARRGHQIGTQLLSQALAWLDARGRLPLYVGVWSQNLGAQRLYGRFGFHKVGEYDFPVGRHVDREFILERPAALR